VSTSPTAPLSFTGVSQYATDYQAVLTRAGQIAQIPVRALQNRDTAILAQKTALGTLNSAVSDLAASLSSLGTVASNQALSAASSDSSVLTATSTGATVPASYTINSVTSIARAASERSVNGFADAGSTPASASATKTMKLVVGSQTYTFSLTTNSLVGLRDKINGLGAGISASILTTSGGNYLSVSAQTTGATTVQLIDDPIDPVTNPTGGNTNFLSYTPTTVTSAQTDASFADPNATAVSATGTMNLLVGGVSHTLVLGANTLTGLRDQINGLGAGVTASIVTNSGRSSLSIASDSGPTTLQLIDDPTGASVNVLQSQGANAVFQLSGINISQAGNVVNSVVPGVTFTLHGTSSSPVTLSLASDSTKLSSALQDFVAKYNALRTQIAGQAGSSGGALSGDSAISQLQNMMRQLTSYYTTSGTVQSLADLGVEFSKAGPLSFDQTKFNSLTSTQISDGFTFLGSATSGVGGFSTRLTQFSDPITGLIKAKEDGIDRTDKSLQRQITTLTDRINIMQTNLLRQMEAADAAQAALQSQQSGLNASLVSLSYVLYGKNPNQAA
jgi:flagellar hook-associated protein 2